MGNPWKREVYRSDQAKTSLAVYIQVDKTETGFWNDIIHKYPLVSRKCECDGRQGGWSITRCEITEISHDGSVGMWGRASVCFVRGTT